MPRARLPAGSVLPGSSTRVVPGQALSTPNPTSASPRVRSGPNQRKETTPCASGSCSSQPRWSSWRSRQALPSHPRPTPSTHVVLDSTSSMRSGRSPLPTVTPTSASPTQVSSKAATDIQNYVKAVQVDEYLRALGAQVVGEYIASLMAAEAQAAAAQPHGRAPPSTPPVTPVTSWRVSAIARAAETTASTTPVDPVLQVRTSSCRVPGTRSRRRPAVATSSGWTRRRPRLRTRTPWPRRSTRSRVQHRGAARADDSLTWRGRLRPSGGQRQGPAGRSSRPGPLAFRTGSPVLRVREGAGAPVAFPWR